MELKVYLVKNKIKVQDFADSIGYTRTSVSRIISARANAGNKFIKLVEQATNGEVTHKDFVNIKRKTSIKRE